jgi:APA family basic amino acid/polyamine antiporter
MQSRIKPQRHKGHKERLSLCVLCVFVVLYGFMKSISEATLAAGRSRGKLLRILGVGFGLAVIIGNTIGSGILRTPAEVAARLPDPWLFLGVWILGGLYALLGAFSIAELGTMLPRSGGQYVFARHALGEYAGFIVGWSDWISTCGTSAAVSIIIAEYTSVLIPFLSGKTIPVALSIITFFAIMQWRGLRFGSRFQEVSSLLKTLAFVALVVACFVLGGNRAPVAEASIVPTGLPLFIAVIIALQSVIYTYDGWTGVIYFSEEVREPARDIPRAIFGGLLSIIGIYLLVNLALLYVLPLDQLAKEKLAAGAAAQAIFGQYGDTVIRLLMILSLLSSINAYKLMATRVLFAMSRDGLFSERAVEVNKGGTPTIALFVSTAVSAIFILSGTFEQVIAVLAFFFVANYTISFISIFVLRRREPTRERPYRAWGYPWTTGLVLAGSVAFLIGAVASDTRNSVYSLILLAASYPVFRLFKNFNKPQRHKEQI